MADSKQPDFEQALQELEQIVQSLENRSLKLRDAMKAFSRGRELADFCSKELIEAQNQLKIHENQDS